ncbi:MAG: hypothetical protein PHO56_02550 [Patescibacteria group bacterium]|nr:hypothetical protein [Patescibacteria group bacterium]
MKKILFLFFTILLLAPSIALADDSFPSFPMSFYGSAKLDNASLPANSIIQAFVNNSLVGQVTLNEAGIYGYDNPTKIRLTIGEYSENEIIFKYVLPGTSIALTGGSTNKYSGTFESGKTQSINFVFTTVSAPPGNQPSGGSGGGGSVTKPITVPAPVKIISTSTLPVTSNVPMTMETTEVLGSKIINYSAFNTLFGLDGALANDISHNEAETITSQQELLQLNKVNENLYNRVVGSYLSKLSDSTKKAIVYFIQVGTPTTKRLGSGEQAGSLNSYISAFNKVPSSTVEWQDVVKIANGRWPAQKSQTAEDNAVAKFKKVYLRVPDMKNVNDNAAVTVITYGLRPASRNTNSEKAAIKSFKVIFKYNPTSAVDWDIVRAIAYSGAKR